MRLAAATGLVLLLLLVSGCASRPAKTAAGDPMAAQVQREHRLAGETSWSFRGRLAVAVGGDGGSGSLQWRQQGEDLDIRLTAPVTGQAWHLVWVSGVSRLSGLQGGDRVGDDPQALLEQATGWPLPLAAMADWLRGLRHGDSAELEFDAQGLPRLLREQGWTVEFRSWDDDSRPIRIHARRGDASVRLAIDAWDSP